MVNSPATVPQGTQPFVTVLAVVLTLSMMAPKAIAAPVDDLLAAPVSAGTLALLSAHTDDPRAVDRIAAGLTDARAEVRRAAARVVAATGLRRLTPQALAALRLERDAETAVELAGAVVRNDSAERDAEVISLALALGPEVARRVAHVLAWVRRADAIRHLDQLAKDANGKYDDEFLAIATRGSAAMNVVAVRAIRDADTDLWSAVVRATDWAVRPLDNGLIRTGLTRPALRLVLLWSLATADTSSGPPEGWTAARQSVLTAAREAVDPTTADPDTLFALSILGRTLGEIPKDDPRILDWLGKSGSAVGDRFFLASRMAAPLTPAEESALEKRAARLGIPWPHSSPARNAKSSEPPIPKPPSTIIRTVGGFPSGYFADVLRAGGCRLDNTLVAMDVAYDVAGRVGTVGTLRSAASESCNRVFQALVRSSVQRSPSLPGVGEQLVLPLVREFVACASEPESLKPPFREFGPGVRVTPPRKIKDRRPVYPYDAIKAQIQGVVYFEATISASGCVKDLELTREVAPSLNAAALRAILEWRFKPTEIQGIVVPVKLSVAVSFTLR